MPKRQNHQIWRVSPPKTASERGPIKFERSTPEVIQDKSQVLTTSTEQCKHRITQFTFERTAIQPTLSLHVSDDRLNPERVNLKWTVCFKLIVNFLELPEALGS